MITITPATTLVDFSRSIWPALVQMLREGTVEIVLPDDGPGLILIPTFHMDELDKVTLHNGLSNEGALSGFAFYQFVVSSTEDGTLSFRPMRMV